LQAKRGDGRFRVYTFVCPEGFPFDAEPVWLNRLIAAEQADRQARSLNYPLKSARFPIHRDLMDFDWGETPLPKHRIEQLASAGFVDQACNLILVGGTGKTHLATALGVAAIHQGKRVRFYNAVDRVNHGSKAAGLALATWPKQLAHRDTVILDELGYLPFPASGGAQAIPPDKPAV
jgi:DNA replication protein DnaC